MKDLPLGDARDLGAPIVGFAKINRKNG